MVPVGPRRRPDSPYRDWYVWSDDRARRPAPGHGVPRLPGRDLDLRRHGRGLVLPPLLRLPARPEHGQPRGPRRRSRRSSRSGCSSAWPGSGWTRAPFIIELHRAGQPGRRARTSTGSPSCASTSRGGAATRSCWPRPTSSPTSCWSTSATRRLGNRLPDAVRLHAQRPTVPRPGPARTRSRSSRRCATPRRCPPAASGRRSCATTTRSTCPGSPPTQRDEVFAAFGPGRGHAALRPGHPPPARARCSATTGAGIELAYALQFTPARHPGDPLRRGDRHGRGPVAARAGRDHAS